MGRRARALVAAGAICLVGLLTQGTSSSQDVGWINEPPHFTHATRAPHTTHATLAPHATTTSKAPTTTSTVASCPCATTTTALHATTTTAAACSCATTTTVASTTSSTAALAAVPGSSTTVIRQAAIPKTGFDMRFAAIVIVAAGALLFIGGDWLTLGVDLQHRRRDDD